MGKGWKKSDLTVNVLLTLFIMLHMSRKLNAFTGDHIYCLFLLVLEVLNVHKNIPDIEMSYQDT